MVWMLNSGMAVILASLSSLFSHRTLHFGKTKGLQLFEKVFTPFGLKVVQGDNKTQKLNNAKAKGP